MVWLVTFAMVIKGRVGLACLNVPEATSAATLSTGISVLRRDYAVMMAPIGSVAVAIHIMVPVANR